MMEEKKVRLCIASCMREDQGGVHTSKTAHRGLLKRTDARLVLEYDDEQDGEKAHIILTAENGCASMQRKGMTSARLSFEPGKRTNSAYVTMYGEIPVAVDTRRAAVMGDSMGGRLTLDYDVYMGGEKTSSALLEISWRA